MRILLLIILTFVILNTSLYAENSENLFQYNLDNKKYPIILTEIIVKSKLLDLDEKEKGYISYLEKFYLKVLNEKTESYNKNNMELKNIFRNKNINLKESRKIVRENAELYLQIGYTFIESLDYLKNNLEYQKFE
ncbi:MAG: hypothetical protein ACRENO_07490, partial [Thermodesulfobacteriota bacterium]